MKTISLFLSFIFLSFLARAQAPALIKDTLIPHYLNEGKIVSPLDAKGKFHKKTRRKKGAWTEYAVVTDFQYKFDEKANEPKQKFAQYLEKAEGSYKDGKRNGIWDFYLITYGSLKPIKYKSETYVLGDKSGEFKYYFEDGSMGILGNNTAGKYDGPVKSFYTDGSTYGLRIYKAGKATGKHVYYFRDGSIKMVLYYLNDKKHGSQKTYYQGGVLKEEYSNKNNKANGIYRFYHPNGKLWVEKIYQNDLLVNVTALKDAEGNDLEIGNFKNGNGDLNFYDSKGQVYAIKTYKNGVKVRTQKMAKSN